MSQEELSKVFKVPPNQYRLAQRLVQEIGFIDGTRFESSKDAPQIWWRNNDFTNPSMVIRQIIREDALNRLGYKPRGEWIPDSPSDPEPGQGIVLRYNEDQATSDLKRQKITEYIGKPDYQAYEWSNGIIEDIGPFNMLRQQTGKAIIDNQTGVVLFSDEVKRLAAGEVVETFHSAGLGWGFLSETKEAYVVVGEQLKRIRASFSD